jgi:hypothetical protein
VINGKCVDSTTEPSSPSEVWGSSTRRGPIRSGIRTHQRRGIPRRRVSPLLSVERSGGANQKRNSIDHLFLEPGNVSEAWSLWLSCSIELSLKLSILKNLKPKGLFIRVSITGHWSLWKNTMTIVLSYVRSTSISSIVHSVLFRELVSMVPKERIKNPNHCVLYDNKYAYKVRIRNKIIVDDRWQMTDDCYINNVIIHVLKNTAAGFITIDTLNTEH